MPDREADDGIAGMAQAMVDAFGKRAEHVATVQFYAACDVPGPASSAWLAIARAIGDHNHSPDAASQRDEQAGRPSSPPTISHKKRR